ncbi:MAG: hypothetical protein ABIN37_13800 [Burkholderiaceae bacterium]
MATRSVNTCAVERRDRRATPKLPHEQDESVGMTGGTGSKSMKQAHKDMERGLQDTDRGPVVDLVYSRLKR